MKEECVGQVSGKEGCVIDRKVEEMGRHKRTRQRQGSLRFRPLACQQGSIWPTRSDPSGPPCARDAPRMRHCYGGLRALDGDWKWYPEYPELVP